MLLSWLLLIEMLRLTTTADCFLLQKLVLTFFFVNRIHSLFWGWNMKTTASWPGRGNGRSFRRKMMVARHHYLPLENIWKRNSTHFSRKSFRDISSHQKESPGSHVYLGSKLPSRTTTAVIHTGWPKSKFTNSNGYICSSENKHFWSHVGKAKMCLKGLLS